MELIWFLLGMLLALGLTEGGMLYHERAERRRRAEVARRRFARNWVTLHDGR